MSTSHRSFPKDREKKLKETIKELKSQINHLEKQNKFMKDEAINLLKPVRERKVIVDKSKLSFDDWRKDFVKRFEREVLKKNE